jgi:FtsZ-binding cell division protein ZapB
VKDTDIIAAIAPDAVSLMDKSIAEIKRLRQENATLTAERDEARREIDKLRREICDWASGNGKWEDMKSVAKRYGWDCFKEANNAKNDE